MPADRSQTPVMCAACRGEPLNGPVSPEELEGLGWQWAASDGWTCADCSNPAGE